MYFALNILKKDLFFLTWNDILEKQVIFPDIDIHILASSPHFDFIFLSQPKFFENFKNTYDSQNSSVLDCFTWRAHVKKAYIFTISL